MNDPFGWFIIIVATLCFCFSVIIGDFVGMIAMIIVLLILILTDVARRREER